MSMEKEIDTLIEAIEKGVEVMKVMKADIKALSEHAISLEMRVSKLENENE